MMQGTTYSILAKMARPLVTLVNTSATLAIAALELEAK
jgi:hypothetical protein